MQQKLPQATDGLMGSPRQPRVILGSQLTCAQPSIPFQAQFCSCSCALNGAQYM